MTLLHQFKTEQIITVLSKFTWTNQWWNEYSISEKHLKWLFWTQPCMDAQSNFGQTLKIKLIHKGLISWSKKNSWFLKNTNCDGLDFTLHEIAQ